MRGGWWARHSRRSVWVPLKVRELAEAAIVSDREHVRWVQQVLGRHGWPPGPVDGVLGPRTRDAVRLYQRAYAGVDGGPARLAADGVPGPLTTAAAKLLPYLSDHFQAGELDCRHCGACYVDGRLLEALETLRARLGHTPVRVISAYRCSVHNRAVGGAARSQHLQGRAVDLATWVGHDVAVDVGVFGGIGVRGSRASHVDVRHVEGRPRDAGVAATGPPTTWRYG